MKFFFQDSFCHLCNKTVVSDAALRQHCLSKHGMHLCLFCGRSCASGSALEQHTTSKHAALPMLTAVHHGHGSRTTTLPLPHAHNDPFPGASGHWAPRTDFRGNKSFGRFECKNKNCAKSWGSAHAFAEYEQGCQRCETMILPCCMWVNNESDSREYRDSDDDNNDRPHDIDRCAACRAGACLQTR